MTDKTGRNDPCPCGSRKKYKQCCLSKQHSVLPGKRKFKATLISSKASIATEQPPAQPPEQPAALPEGPDLIQRAYGSMLRNTDGEEHNK